MFLPKKTQRVLYAFFKRTFKNAIKILKTLVIAMKIGYLNAQKTKGGISTSVRALLSRGVESTQVLSQLDKSDWKDFERFLSTMKPGDVIMIHSLFDFCVSIKDLFRFASMALSAKVSVQSVCEDWFDTARAESSQAEFLKHVERFYFDCIARQTKIGLEKARRNGKKIGRKVGSRKITDEQLSKAYNDYKNGSTLIASCTENKVSQSTLYRYIRINSLPTRS